MVSKELGAAAIDDAFKAQVGVLFSVLCRGLVVDHDKSAIAAFRRGLNIATNAHDEATAAFEDLTKAP